MTAHPFRVFVWLRAVKDTEVPGKIFGEPRFHESAQCHYQSDAEQVARLLSGTGMYPIVKIVEVKNRKQTEIKTYYHPDQETAEKTKDLPI